jgi:hypothetical protein
MIARSTTMVMINGNCDLVARGDARVRRQLAMDILNCGGGRWSRRTPPRTRSTVDSHSKCDTGYVRSRHGNELQPPQP